MSLEDLTNIEVTSVSKKPEKLSEAPAAVFVISREDVRRSGATTLAEALRLAPNLEVARQNSNAYAISARGFQTALANKLLVLIDGRSVYTPFYSGTYWDSQDVMLEDVDRIEVVSGPGGTLWGSNAVNGVINIITRGAKDTQGALLTGSAGSKDEKAAAAARYGGSLPGDGAYRIYAKYFEDASTALASGMAFNDAWHMAQAGFRTDWSGVADTFTVQGDGYKNQISQPLGYPDKTTEGANLLGRWGRTFSKDSNLQVQFYLDHTRRDYPGSYKERRNTLDLDIQHRFKIGDGNEILWGGGYRTSSDQAENLTPTFAFIPDSKDLRLINIFAQDEIALVLDKLDLTLGAKLEHNDYTGWETEPNARLAWKPAAGQMLWASVSRATRTPSRVDRDLFAPALPPYYFAGGPDFRSEIVTAYELGYRLKIQDRFSFSVSPYYNAYRYLRTVGLPPGSAALTIANNMEGKTYGVELWGDIKVTDTWRLRPGYAYLREHLELTAPYALPTSPSGEANDPRHRLLLTSLLSLGSHVELDGTIRHISSLPDPVVPAYTTMDAHIGWKPAPGLEVAIIGQSLFGKQHIEFAQQQQPGAALERAGLVKVTWTF
ncbi:MAG TPA: TonB-dependent receptor [Holophagaceae bacterium]|nr:TonB-dependent receptor [Holophagaceae bacterium]